MNIHYVRAAILQATGINLTLNQTKQYLLDEGLVTPREASRLIFVGYADYHGGVTSRDEVEEDVPELNLIEDIPVEIDDDVKAAIIVALDGI